MHFLWMLSLRHVSFVLLRTWTGRYHWKLRVKCVPNAENSITVQTKRDLTRVGNLIDSPALSKSLNSRQLSLSFVLNSQTLSLTLLSAKTVWTLVNYHSRLVWTLRHSYCLSCALKEFELSSTVALVWPSISPNLIDRCSLYPSGHFVLLHTLVYLMFNLHIWQGKKSTYTRVQVLR